MSAFYVILFLVSSVTISKKLSDLIKSIKQGDKEKISIDIFFLLLTFLIIVILIAIKKVYMS